MSRPQIVYKKALTFEEKITAAYLYYVRGNDQQDIAIAMGGVNMGRVNEACGTIKDALLKDQRADSVTVLALQGAVDG